MDRKRTQPRDILVSVWRSAAVQRPLFQRGTQFPFVLLLRTPPSTFPFFSSPALRDIYRDTPRPRGIRTFSPFRNNAIHEEDYYPQSLIFRRAPLSSAQLRSAPRHTDLIIDRTQTAGVITRRRVRVWQQVTRCETAERKRSDDRLYARRDATPRDATRCTGLRGMLLYVQIRIFSANLGRLFLYRYQGRRVSLIFSSY